MTLEVGNLVTRYKYNHDVVFKILSIKNETAYLKGVNVRLYADAPLEDLKIYQNDTRSVDEDEPYYSMTIEEIIFSSRKSTAY